MIVVAGTLKLSPQSLAALRPTAEATVRATRMEAGCIVYAFSEDITEPGLIRIYEEWESREALDAHGRSDHIAAWRKAVSQAEILSRDLKLAEIERFEAFS